MTNVATVCAADLDNRRHHEAIVTLLEMYAAEPLVGGQLLSTEARTNLIPALKAQTNGRYFLAFHAEEPVGLAICFVGLSTFRAKPVLNIHDLAVHREWRGQGIGRQLLQAVEAEAQQLGCCTLTLEVKEQNPARRLYERVGFEGGSPDGGTSLFMAKRLV